MHFEASAFGILDCNSAKLRPDRHLTAMRSSFTNTARILITGITSIHGWPLYQKLQSVVPPDRLFGIRPPNMRMPESGNVASACMTEDAGARADQG